MENDLNEMKKKIENLFGVEKNKIILNSFEKAQKKLKINKSEFILSFNPKNKTTSKMWSTLLEKDK